LVEHFIRTADRAGWKIGGNRKLRGRYLFYLGLGQLASAFPDDHPIIIVRHRFLLSIARGRLLVQNVVWIADRAGSKFAGKSVCPAAYLYEFILSK
jgi:hypothetical protein